MVNRVPSSEPPVCQPFVGASIAQKDYPATAALILCASFGIALIINTQLVSDGVWYWYSLEFLEGRRLYGDIGIALQPMHILINALSIRLLGPSWILYQRQLANLEMHEKTFHSGKPLPHRALDKLLMARVSTGHWLVIRRFSYGKGNDWMLVRTK